MKEGAGLCKSVCPMSEKNGWRCSGGQLRLINIISVDIGIKSEAMLPVKDVTCVLVEHYTDFFLQEVVVVMLIF